MSSTWCHLPYFYLHLRSQPWIPKLSIKLPTSYLCSLVLYTFQTEKVKPTNLIHPQSSSSQWKGNSVFSVAQPKLILFSLTHYIQSIHHLAVSSNYIQNMTTSYQHDRYHPPLSDWHVFPEELQSQPNEYPSFYVIITQSPSDPKWSHHCADQNAAAVPHPIQSKLNCITAFSPTPSVPRSLSNHLPSEHSLLFRPSDFPTLPWTRLVYSCHRDFGLAFPSAKNAVPSNSYITHSSSPSIFT